MSTSSSTNDASSTVYPNFSYINTLIDDDTQDKDLLHTIIIALVNGITNVKAIAKKTGYSDARIQTGLNALTSALLLRKSGETYTLVGPTTDYVYTPDYIQLHIGSFNEDKILFEELKRKISRRIKQRDSKGKQRIIPGSDNQTNNLNEQAPSGNEQIQMNNLDEQTNANTNKATTTHSLHSRYDNIQKAFEKFNTIDLHIDGLMNTSSKKHHSMITAVKKNIIEEVNSEIKTNLLEFIDQVERATSIKIQRIHDPCPICLCPVQDPHVLKGCGHLMCSNCINNCRGNTGIHHLIKCPTCRTKSESIKLYI
jgi:hypothetical protein